MSTIVNTIIFKKWSETPAFSNVAFWETKMYSFAGPKNKFNVMQLIIVGKGLSTTIDVLYRDSVEGTYHVFGSGFFGTAVDTRVIFPQVPSNLKGLDSIQLKFQFTTLGNSTLAIDDIYIVYRTYRELSVNED